MTYLKVMKIPERLGKPKKPLGLYLLKARLRHPRQQQGVEGRWTVCDVSGEQGHDEILAGVRPLCPDELYRYLIT